MSDIARIRELNDTFRRGDGSSIAFCTAFTITQGVAALGDDFIEAATAAVVAYDGFTETNDPYGSTTSVPSTSKARNFSGRSTISIPISSSGRTIRVIPTRRVGFSPSSWPRSIRP